MVTAETLQTSVPHGAPSGAVRRREAGISLSLVVLAGAGWWWSVRMADGMAAPGEMPIGGAAMGTASLGVFLLGWFAMMAAMMFPAISPVVKLYARAARVGSVAPLPVFVAGYMIVWTVVGVPAYLAFTELEVPLMEARPWAGRLAGSTLLVAAVWQLTPLKALCLRHCRSPMSFFMRAGQGIGRPLGAVRMGVVHGAYCLGCCWAMFAVLVALGTMHLAWMVGLTVLIVLEKNGPRGETVALFGGLAFALAGAALVLDPSVITIVT